MVRIMGRRYQAIVFELIGVLQAYLGAESAAAMSVEHIYAFCQEERAGKTLQAPIGPCSPSVARSLGADAMCIGIDNDRVAFGNRYCSGFISG